MRRSLHLLVLFACLLALGLPAAAPLQAAATPPAQSATPAPTDTPVVIARSLPAAAKIAGGTDTNPTPQARAAQSPAVQKSGGGGVSLASIVVGAGLFVGSLSLGWLLGKRLKPRRFE